GAVASISKADRATSGGTVGNVDGRIADKDAVGDWKNGLITDESASGGIPVERVAVEEAVDYAGVRVGSIECRPAATRVASCQRIAAEDAPRYHSGRGIGHQPSSIYGPVACSIQRVAGECAVVQGECGAAGINASAQAGCLHRIADVVGDR